MSRQSSIRTPHEYKVARSDLPLACPNRLVGEGIAHPRVFLSFEDGRAVCPYCGTEYLIEESAASA